VLKGKKAAGRNIRWMRGDKVCKGSYRDKNRGRTLEVEWKNGLRRGRKEFRKWDENIVNRLRNDA